MYYINMEIHINKKIPSKVLRTKLYPSQLNEVPSFTMK